MKEIFAVFFCFLIVGCSDNQNGKPLEKPILTKDTIDKDAINHGLSNGDLIIKYLNNKGQEIEYHYNDTINIALSYNTQWPALNRSHKLIVKPLTGNLEIIRRDNNNYTLIVDTFSKLKDFEYEIRMRSEACVFKSSELKPKFYSEVGLLSKIYSK